ncbi:hypothetical protein C8A03DRAFT_35926 [Achaetomium macrosporum]|uniref:Uncharacterized protein n=1 Tax=Achaetomium macrosporum TaxID=79813 RepID=A0AAN7C7I1_9PEZI|nr:hypothetical protein C8A03DRAFT_35926 [Achaetomium macrosporum]
MAEHLKTHFDKTSTCYANEVGELEATVAKMESRGVLIPDSSDFNHPAGVHNFSLEPNGKTAFDAPQGFHVIVDILEIGNGGVERIHATEPW